MTLKMIFYEYFNAKQARTLSETCRKKVKVLPLFSKVVTGVTILKLLRGLVSVPQHILDTLFWTWKV